MSARLFSIGALAVALAASTAAVYAQPGASDHAYTQPGTAHHASMANLEGAAQRLREAIQAMARQAPGQDRTQAMADANHALADAQAAMAVLGPPAARPFPARHPIGAAPVSDREAMHKLRQASDRLYDAVHAMSRAPAGERRNAAIDEVNQALIATQGAISWAADQRLASASTQAPRSVSSMPTLALHPGNPVEDLQVRLKLAGFYDGSVDGRMSAHTSRSLRAFQQAHGLSATGRLDARTIAAVGMISGPIPAGGTMPVGGTMSQAGGSVGNMR